MWLKPYRTHFSLQMSFFLLLLFSAPLSCHSLMKTILSFQIGHFLFKDRPVKKKRLNWPPLKLHMGK